MSLNGNTFRTLEFEADPHTSCWAMPALRRAGAPRASRSARSRGKRCAAPWTGRAEAVRPARSDWAASPTTTFPTSDEPAGGPSRGASTSSPRALLDVASFIEGSGEIARRVAAARQRPPSPPAPLRWPTAGDLSAAIRRAILPSGEVADDASPRLSELRRSLLRLKAQLHSVMESFLRGQDADRLLQDKVVTTRNDRYVLLLKAEHRGQLPGIVHGSSGSGASVFVEPMPAVELNNDIVSLQDEERREVIRILTELSGRVGMVVSDLALAVEVMGELDALQAMALAARDMDAVEPEMIEGPPDASAGRAGEARPSVPLLDLKDARHPLLMSALAERLGLPRRSSREPVPVSLRVGSEAPVLIISGPNTGGKTVALKTVGLLALMAQSGLHVPAGQGSRLPVFQRVYADIGDDQSIAENLSTFSAHLASIVEMTRDLALPALVLLDEVGAGTDPTEGGALGVAIVEHFRARGAMVVATTHHGLMKAYAQSTPGVACASFGYDPETYEPTYRLTLGVAGRSLALEMAERLGLPASLVAEARSRRDEKEAQAEALLQKLERDQASLEREQARLAEERAASRAEQERLLGVEREIEAKRRSLVSGFAKDLARRGEELARQAADAIQQAVKRVETAQKPKPAAVTAARADVLREIHEAQAAALRSLPEVEPEPVLAEIPIAVGMRARVRTLGVVGEVMSLGHGEAELAVGGKRLRVPVGELLAVGGGRGGATGRCNLRPERVKSSGGVPAELNLVGLRVEEALPLVDKLLDDAALSDRREIRVIHGFGSGRLRKAVVGLLARPPPRGLLPRWQRRRGRRRRHHRRAEGLTDPMAFPDSFVEEVRQAADIVRLMSEHVSLKKMGTSWKGLCPFHHEKTPSFNVRTEPPLFHCFGCGEGGDVFKFVMLHERVGFPEAVEIVARRFGVGCPSDSSEVGPERKEREEMLGLLEAAAQHFTRNLWGGPGAKAREYLLGRGFGSRPWNASAPARRRDSWTDLLDALRRKFSRRRSSPQAWCWSGRRAAATTIASGTGPSSRS